MPNDKKKMQKPYNNSSDNSNLSNKKKLKKPSAKMLGTGMAREAAEAIKKRNKMIEDVWKQTL